MTRAAIVAPVRTAVGRFGGKRAVIWPTTSLAVSAHAVVPPLAYSLTPSPEEGI